MTRALLAYAFASLGALAILLIVFGPIMTLSGCAPSAPQPPKVVYVPIRAACIDAKDIPPAVPMTDLNGHAQHDSDMLDVTDNLLRAQVTTLMALIVPACIR